MMILDYQEQMPRHSCTAAATTYLCARVLPRAEMPCTVLKGGPEASKALLVCVKLETETVLLICEKLEILLNFSRSLRRLLGCQWMASHCWLVLGGDGMLRSYRANCATGRNLIIGNQLLNEKFIDYYTEKCQNW